MFSRKNSTLTQDLLYRLYIVEGKTRYEIAPLFGYKPTGIGKLLHVWKIRKCRERGTGTITKGGYRMITVEGRQIFEHRFVMELHLGRKLRKSEKVHHRNHNKLDNNIANLEIVSMSEHKKIHHPEIGSSTRFQPLYNFDPRQAVKLYGQMRSSQRVADHLGCAEITARRVITQFTGKSLKELKQTL